MLVTLALALRAIIGDAEPAWPLVFLGTGLSLVLSGSALVIVIATWALASERSRITATKRAILLNDSPRPAAASAAARLRSSWRMACVASIVGLFAVLFATAWARDSHTGFGESWLGTIAAWVLVSLMVAAIVSAALGVKYGRRVRLEERRRRSQVVEQHDLPEREFVLYLRSFTDDVASSRLVGVGGLSMEEQFVRTLNQIGPVVAVGSPGEDQPHAGAYRLYLDNTAWQQSVDQLLEKARLVVIRTGVSAGLHWELERVVRRVSPRRVLMVVDDKVEMRRCLERLRNVHPQVSPSVGLGWRRVCGIRGLLIFDEQWRVSKLRLRGRGIYASRSRNFVEPGLARSLYPVFQTLGVEWPRPSVDWLLPLTKLPVVAIWILFASIALGMLIWASSSLGS